MRLQGVQGRRRGRGDSGGRSQVVLTAGVGRRVREGGGSSGDGFGREFHGGGPTLERRLGTGWTRVTNRRGHGGHLLIVLLVRNGIHGEGEPMFSLFFFFSRRMLVKVAVIRFDGMTKRSSRGTSS